MRSSPAFARDVGGGEASGEVVGTPTACSSAAVVHRDAYDVDTLLEALADRA